MLGLYWSLNDVKHTILVLQKQFISTKHSLKGGGGGGEGEGKKEKKEGGKKGEGIGERRKGTPAIITPLTKVTFVCACSNYSQVSGVFVLFTEQTNLSGRN